MKVLFQFVAGGAITLTLVLRVFAQPSPTEANPTAENSRCNEEAHNALYQRFLETYKTDQPNAYSLAKECLQRCHKASEQSKYLRHWIEIYEANERTRLKTRVVSLIEQARFEESFVIGRQILASEPGDLGTLLSLVNGGLIAVAYGNKAIIAEAGSYARRALKLLESDQVTVENKVTMVAWLNRSIGILFLSSAPAESATFLYKALQFDAFKNDAHSYSFLADAIVGSQYLPLQNEYETRFSTGKSKDSAEGKRLRAKLDKAADYVIDALARAAALAASNEQMAPVKAKWMKILTILYTFRNSGYDTGLQEYIDRILAKPLPR